MCCMTILLGVTQPRLLSRKSASPRFQPHQKGHGKHFILSTEARLKTEGQNDYHPPGQV